MNKFTVIFSSVIILLACSFCSATKDISTENHPFKVTKATYNTWVGGQPGVRGINISIIIDNPEIKLDSVFFRNMKTKLKSDRNSKPVVFLGTFIHPNTKKDYILHKNEEKEYGNKPQNMLTNFPFQLQEDEAIISYIFKEKTRYYKIEKLKEIKSVIMY